MNDIPAGHAAIAAEAIRALNHATLPGRPGLVEPADAYRVFTDLALLADRLGQAIDQVQQFLDREALAGTIRIVDGEHRGDLHAAIADCRSMTGRAAVLAGRLGALLHAAQNTVTWAAASGRGDDTQLQLRSVVLDQPERQPRVR